VNLTGYILLFSKGKRRRGREGSKRKKKRITAVLHYFSEYIEQSLEACILEQPYFLPRPISSMKISAAFSPIANAVLLVFAATLRGRILKSATLSPSTP
jgi:hypothetical protein